MAEKEKRTALKLFRIQKGLSQEDFSEKLGFSRGQYARFENGKAENTLRFLKSLASNFGITFDEAQALAKRDNEK